MISFIASYQDRFYDPDGGGEFPLVIVLFLALLAFGALNVVRCLVSNFIRSFWEK